MSMRVESILGGAGQLRQIEIGTGDNVYRGFAAQVFAPDLGRWARQYVNAVRGRFARLESEAGESTTTWRSATPGLKRESRLVSERAGVDRWRRSMSISEEGGTSWSELWIDELERDARLRTD